MLLISPYAKGLSDPTAYPPLGLLYVAANMPNSRCDVFIMENDNFDKFYYDSYGISVHSVGVVNETKHIISLIHKYNPKAIIFVGGAAVSLIPHLPYVIRLPGEAEKYFDVDTSNLDNIKFPARHLVDKKFIVHTGGVHHTNEPSTTMIATRGCPYECTFCDKAIHGRKFRKRSVENILTEIKQLKLMYGIKWIRFIDDCITIDKKWFANLCLALADMDIKWTCLSRADCVDTKLLKLMKYAGCQEVFFGFESGSQKLLDMMKKRISVEANAKAIQMCKDAGILSCAYMMFGFPGEDDDTVNETIDFLERTKPDKSRISQYIPIPGSDVWERPYKYMVEIKSNFEDYWYFDQNDFALKYCYITQKRMKILRRKIMKYYEKSGYFHNWTKEKVA